MASSQLPSGARPPGGVVRKVRSSPQLQRSPFAQPLGLCTANVGNRRVVLESVMGLSVRVKVDQRMPFVSFERGLEWERSHTMAQLPKDPLPPLADVLTAVMQMQIKPKTPPQERKKKAAFGGAGVVRIGPKLPLQRPRLVTASPEHARPMSPVEAEERRRRAAAKEAAQQGETDSDARGGLRKKKTVGDSDQEESAGGPGLVDAEGKQAGQAAGDQRAKHKVEDTGELPFPWSDAELQDVFAKFDSDRDSEIHKDDLPGMLRYIGARNADEEAKRIVEGQTMYATLSFQEFLEFMAKFREYDVERMSAEFSKAAFSHADRDFDGMLNFNELYRLLFELGYAPTTQSTLEALEELDKDANMKVSMREFDALRDYLRRTEGMTKHDVKELQDLFDKTVNGNNGREPGPDEIWRITMYLGYSATLDTVRSMASEVDFDGNHEVSFSEMLKILRQVREKEQEEIIAVMRNHRDDSADDGDMEMEALPLEDLVIALEDLGYFVSEEAMWEILDDLGDTDNEESLSKEEFTNFILRYRFIEGFTQEEREELEAVFNKEGRGNMGALRTLDLGRVLRWLGHALSVQQVQNLVSWIDLDNSGELELGEFLKLMRRIEQDDSRLRHEIFSQFVNPRTGEVPLRALSEAVSQIQGGEPNKEFIDKALKRLAMENNKQDDALKRRPSSSSKSSEEEKEAPPVVLPEFLNLAAFDRFFGHYHHELVQEVHTNASYSVAEVQKLRDSFEQYDKDKSGTVERDELVQLLTAYFPDATKSKKQQQELQKMVLEVDEDGNGELEFKEYLELMRKCDDARDAQELEMEREVIQEYGFTQEEVEGFRQIFSSRVDWKGELSLDTIIELLAQVVELNQEALNDLARVVCEVHPQGREVARFPHFLKVIKRITEANHGRINEMAARTLRRQQANKNK